MLLLFDITVHNSLHRNAQYGRVPFNVLKLKIEKSVEPNKTCVRCDLSVCSDLSSLLLVGCTLRVMCDGMQGIVKFSFLAPIQ